MSDEATPSQSPTSHKAQTKLVSDAQTTAELLFETSLPDKFAAKT